MITGIFHKGSGLGNQLFRYVATRVLAKDKGVDFGMVAPELFKGKDFMQLDMGKEVAIPYDIEPGTGKVIPRFMNGSLWEEKTPYYNPDINYVEDNTIIDGNFEDIRYFSHRFEEVDEWLQVEPYNTEDRCVIGFRGGEYAAIPELFLPLEYWQRAIVLMKEINPFMAFEVHTDDPTLAKQYFPDYPIIQNVEINWRAMRSAYFAIIANSSFYVLPRLLNGGVTIAPKYWNRYNTKKWEFPQNYYRHFTQI